MKKIIPVALFLFSFSSQAQPVINKNTFSNVLGKTEGYYSYLTSGLDFSNTGEDFFWNFSYFNFSNRSVFEEEYITSNKTPHFSKYPSSNLTKFRSDINEYTYYDTTNNSLTVLGSYSEEGANSYYVDPQTLFVFPISFKSSFFDVYIGKTITSDTSTSIGKYKCICDGYGTLKMPTNTYFNVLRLKCTDTITTTLKPCCGGNTFTKIEENYIWLKNGIDNALLSVKYSRVESSSNPQYITIKVPQSAVTGLEENTYENKYQISPTEYVSVYDIMGEFVASGMLNSLGLESGKLYIIKSGNKSRKIVLN